MYYILKWNCNRRTPATVSTANGILHGTDTDTDSVSHGHRRTRAHGESDAIRLNLVESYTLPLQLLGALFAFFATFNVCVGVAEYGKLYETNAECVLACIRIHTAWNICMESGEPHAVGSL